MWPLRIVQNEVLDPCFDANFTQASLCVESYWSRLWLFDIFAFNYGISRVTENVTFVLACAVCVKPWPGQLRLPQVCLR